MFNIVKNFSLTLIVTVFTALMLAAPTYATTYSNTTYTTTSSANNFYFNDFVADYYLYRDEDGMSKMVVVEELLAVFPTYSQNHGITRVIPFTNNDSKNLTMESDNTIYMHVERDEVDENVEKVEIGDGNFIVYIGDPDKYVTGEQLYTLIYEFQNVTLDHEQDGKKFQELYWDSNGNDWKQRFNSVVARIHLDNAIADKFTGDTSCYVGKYGEKGSERCKITKLTEEVEFDDEHKSDTVIEFASTGKLGAGENLTFVLQFEDGTFAPAKVSYNYTLVAVTVGVIFAAALTIVLMILALSSTAEKRKYYKNLFTKPEYTPLKDLTVAEAAHNYIGKGATGDMKVATLIDLAVNHKVELIKTEEDGAFGKKKTGWKIRIKTNTMNKQQATVLKILAGSDTSLRKDQEITVKSHTATTELTKLLNKFNEQVSDGLIRKGLLVDPKKSKTSAAKSANDTTEKTSDPVAKPDDSAKKAHNYPEWLLIAFIIWMIGGIFLIIFTADYQPSYGELIGAGPLHAVIITAVILMLISSIVIYMLTARYFRITTKGLDASKYLEGLKLYMSMAEAERLKLLQSVKGADTTHEGVVKIYEKLLPYAVIFKMEKTWLEELSRYYEFDDVTSPAWFIGIGAFSARDFSAAMMSASNSVSSTIVHSTVSNSSSGFSGGGGGGFSGGGGGGGGGGGW